MSADDPYATLGLDPGASPEEIAQRYRELAKRFHPDLAGGSEASKMVEINAAHDRLLRGEDEPGHGPRDGGEPAPGPATSPPPPRRAPGDWLDEHTRARIDGELLQELRDGEPVREILDGVEGGSIVRVVVTDRRLLWLRDDAVSGRVRSLPFASVSRVEHRLRRPLRRTAILELHTQQGRRHRFTDLTPAALRRLLHALPAIGAS